jgi:hypothetical protein
MHALEPDWLLHSRNGLLNEHGIVAFGLAICSE